MWFFTRKQKNLTLFKRGIQDYPGDPVVGNLPANAVRPLVRKDPTCHGAIKPMRHNSWACVLEPRGTPSEPTCHKCWGPGARSPPPPQEQPPWGAHSGQLVSSPCSLEESPCSSKDPAAKNKYIKLFLKRRRPMNRMYCWQVQKTRGISLLHRERISNSAPSHPAPRRKRA